MTSTPFGDADNLDDIYARAEQVIRGAISGEPNDLADRAAADLDSMVDRIDNVTAAIEARTWPDNPGPRE